MRIFGEPIQRLSDTETAFHTTGQFVCLTLSGFIKTNRFKHFINFTATFAFTLDSSQARPNNRETPRSSFSKNIENL
jgi:hypothetical protein